MTLILSGTDGLSDIDGTAATPAIRGTDANTGIFFPAADTIAFAEGGAEIARFDSSGNLGIGKSTITAKLDVQRTSGTTEPIGRFEAAVGSYTGTSLIAANTLGASSAYNLFSCITDSDGDAGGPVTEFLVRGDGNVGIGTASPSSPLNVVSASSSLAIAINGRSSDNLGAMYFYANNGSTQHSTLTASATEFRLSSVPAAAVQTFYTNGSERMRLDASGNLLFNSGYGSVATAYGCRAWVNFNGTGTVAIRGSGNVSSITDNGTGDYTVNFATAMPDANYASASIGYHVTGVTEGPVDAYYTVPQTTTSIRIQFRGNAGGDAQLVNYLAIR
jgi:hypothetical protein